MTDALRSHEPGDTVTSSSAAATQSRPCAPRSEPEEADVPVLDADKVIATLRGAFARDVGRDRAAADRRREDPRGRRALHLGLPLHAPRRGAGARGLRRPGDRSHPDPRRPGRVRHRRRDGQGPERAGRPRDRQLHRLQHLDPLRAGGAHPSRRPASWVRSTSTATCPIRSRPRRRRRSGAWPTRWRSCCSRWRLRRITETVARVRGVELFVRRIGGGPPVVVLHGGPGAHHDYLLPGSTRSPTGAS